MTEWQRELIAEEQGLVACPCFAPSIYGSCDGDCEHCQLSMEFESEMEKRLEARINEHDTNT